MPDATQLPGTDRHSESIYEGSILPLGKGLDLESKLFARLSCDPVSRNLILRYRAASVRPPITGTWSAANS